MTPKPLVILVNLHCKQYDLDVTLRDVSIRLRTENISKILGNEIRFESNRSIKETFCFQIGKIY